MEQLSVLNFGDWAGYLFLITLRVLSTFMSSPVFGKSVPAIAKIAFSVLFSYLIFSVMDISVPLEFVGVLDYSVACLKEIILGAVFSIVMYFTFSCIHLAGYTIDMNMGFGFSQLYDPEYGMQVNISSKLLEVILIVLFFLTDTHHTMFRVMAQTFTQIPPGTVTFSTEVVKVAVELFISSFILGIQIAMPVFATTILIEILLGVVMKSVPQMHFFVIGFPIKIFVGFIILMVMIPIFVTYTGSIFETMLLGVQKVFEQIGI